MRPTPDGVSIRAARSEDAADVARLVRAAYSRYVARMGRDPAPMGEDYAAVIAAATVSVAMLGDAVVGFVVLRDGLLENVAVSEGHRGLGLGRLLVGHAEDQARGAGHRQIRLYTHELMIENLRLYAHLGYVETHRVEEDGYRRVYLEKPLAGS